MLTEEKNITLLIKCLEFVNHYAEYPNKIESTHELLKIYNRNISWINSTAIERNSEYLEKKVLEYPVLTIEELDSLQKKKNSLKRMILYFLGGWMVVLAYYSFRIVKTKGGGLEGIKDKLNRIKKINESVIYAIQHPGIEELIDY